MTKVLHKRPSTVAVIQQVTIRGKISIQKVKARLTVELKL